MGASGSGTTTLGRALADHWSVPHADADDYFWVPTVPPYVEKRPETARRALMRDGFVPREGWVLSGSMMGWGESIVAECDAVIFLTLDPRERLRRLEAREVHRRAGQDFDEAAWSDFLDWAKGYDDPSTKAGVIVDWLKADFDLGRGHAMALVHVIKNGDKIDAKHVGTDTAHNDPSDTLWLDGKKNRPA